MASTLRHDSHPDHPLERITDINMGRASCRACDLPLESGKDPYGCRSCGFFLHRHCCHLETSFQNHPAHPQHPLRLLCTAANSRDPYQCNICGKDGKGFRYHCQTCDHYNVHVLCIKLPQKISSRRAHRQHPLQLLYPPLATGRTCSLGCGRQIRHFCYSCNRCNFFSHSECLKKTPMIGSSSYQQAPAAAGAPLNHQQAPTGRPRVNLANIGIGILANFVGGFLGHQASDFLGSDGLWGDGGSENNDVHHGGADFEGDMVNFDGLPDFDGYADGTLQEEFASLAFAHMENMSGESILEDNDVEYWGDDFGNGIGELPGFDGYVDDPIEAEGIALAFAHMERMG